MTLLQSSIRRESLVNDLALNGFKYIKSSSVSTGTNYRLVSIYSGEAFGESKSSLEELVEYSNKIAGTN